MDSHVIISMGLLMISSVPSAMSGWCFVGSCPDCKMECPQQPSLEEISERFASKLDQYQENIKTELERTNNNFTSRLQKLESSIGHLGDLFNKLPKQKYFLVKEKIESMELKLSSIEEQMIQNNDHLSELLTKTRNKILNDVEKDPASTERFDKLLEETTKVKTGMAKILTELDDLNFSNNNFNDSIKQMFTRLDEIKLIHEEEREASKTNFGKLEEVIKSEDKALDFAKENYGKLSELEETMNETMASGKIKQDKIDKVVETLLDGKRADTWTTNQVVHVVILPAVVVFVCQWFYIIYLSCFRGRKIYVDYVKWSDQHPKLMNASSKDDSDSDFESLSSVDTDVISDRTNIKQGYLHGDSLMYSNVQSSDLRRNKKIKGSSHIAKLIYQSVLGRWNGGKAKKICATDCFEHDEEAQRLLNFESDDNEDDNPTIVAENQDKDVVTTVGTNKNEDGGTESATLGERESKMHI